MSEQNTQPQLRRLLWLGPLTVIAAVIGVVVIRVIAVAILQPDPLPISLRWSTPILFTVVLVGAAVVVFALVVRFAKNPIRTYQIVAFVALLLSFLPDLAYPGSGMPGASLAVAIALMIMHVVAWAICVVMLTRWSVGPNKG